MKRLLSVSVKSPLIVAGGHGAGNSASTLDYVPGTALRGAAAAVFLDNSQLQQEISKVLQPLQLSFQEYFHWVFLSGCVRFPNLYPRREQPCASPIPLSARSCKRFPGFSIGSFPYDQRHGVYDVLLKNLLDFRCTDTLGDRRTGRINCEAPMDPFEGFYEAPKSDPRSGRLISVAHRLLARTAIENPTETVEQQQLYSLKVLEEGGVEYTTLAGVVTVDPPEYLSTDAQAAFVDLFIGRHLAGPLMELTIGKAKTRGLGAIQLEVSEDEPKELLPPLEERLEKLQEMWRKVHPEERETTVFTLTLHSDAIILDHLWRFVSVIDQEMLTREIQGFPSCTLRPSYFTRTRLVSGWNAAHRMPKDDELAIQKGAAFLYGTGVSTKNLLPWLHALEESGIGERRSEGFGQVVACHPFHWQGVRT